MSKSGKSPSKGSPMDSLSMKVVWGWSWDRCPSWGLDRLVPPLGFLPGPPCCDSQGSPGGGHRSQGPSEPSHVPSLTRRLRS